jgi:hypothetical protein
MDSNTLGFENKIGTTLSLRLHDNCPVISKVWPIPQLDSTQRNAMQDHGILAPDCASKVGYTYIRILEKHRTSFC